MIDFENIDALNAVFDSVQSQLDSAYRHLLDRESDQLCSDLIAFLAIGIPRGKGIFAIVPNERFRQKFSDDGMIMTLTLQTAKLVVL